VRAGRRCLLQYRGNACSHDMALGTATLRALAEADQAGVKVAAPRYDKSANGGRGDRADAATWPIIEGPVQVRRHG
jgi:D-glycerate 3-kinase